MYNIDQEVYVKGTIVGISKDRDGKFEYEVEFRDEFWGDRRMSVNADQVKAGPLSMEDLEKMCN